MAQTMNHVEGGERKGEIRGWAEGERDGQIGDGHMVSAGLSRVLLEIFTGIPRDNVPSFHGIMICKDSVILGYLWPLFFGGESTHLKIKQ